MEVRGQIHALAAFTRTESACTTHLTGSLVRFRDVSDFLDTKPKARFSNEASPTWFVSYHFTHWLLPYTANWKVNQLLLCTGPILQNQLEQYCGQLAININKSSDDNNVSKFVFSNLWTSLNTDLIICDILFTINFYHHLQKPTYCFNFNTFFQNCSLWDTSSHDNWRHLADNVQSV
jgi:hypothetical protein